MKRIFLVMMAASLFALISSGCKKKDAADTFTGGMLTLSNTTEEDYSRAVTEFFSEKLNRQIDYKVIYYDTLTSMQLALEAGEVRDIALYECVAKYLMAGNDLYTIKNYASRDNFYFALRESDSELYDLFERALTVLKSDGTLDGLIAEYVTSFSDDGFLPAVELPVFPGARQVTVAVTGDLPPLDYIRPDGKAAGFNTAVLSEIAKILGLNINLLSVDTGARVAALASGRADVVFWVRAVDETAADGFGETLARLGLSVNTDAPEGVKMTSPFFSDQIAIVGLK